MQQRIDIFTTLEVEVHSLTASNKWLTEHSWLKMYATDQNNLITI